MNIDRRRRALLAALAGAGLWPLGARARPALKGHVAIVGGGFGGAVCAQTLRRFAPQLKITLIEPRAQFYTGPMSNLAVAGGWALDRVRRTPPHVEGIRLVGQRARALETDPLVLHLADGVRLRADRIVVSPGVQMRYAEIDGLTADNSARVPHAWLGDAQVEILRARVAALEDGATVVIAPPAGAYRCPPGPYERAALIAWQLRQRNIRRARILIVDGKDDFTKRAAMQAEWARLYPGVIEWVPRAQGGEVLAVDVQQQQVTLASGEKIRADLISLIPPQQAAGFAQDTGLADGSGWCPVQLSSFESTRAPGVYVIGDASLAEPMPKSAFSAAAQARLTALVVIASLRGEAPPQGLLMNTCFSLMAPDRAVSVSASYRALGGRLNSVSSGVSASDASDAIRAREAALAYAWYAQASTEAFGMPSDA